MKLEDLKVGSLYLHFSGHVYRYHGATADGLAVIHQPHHPLGVSEGDAGNDPATMVREATMLDCAKALGAAEKSGGDTTGIRHAMLELLNEAPEGNPQ
jgi:hypothetical protein